MKVMSWPIFAGSLLLAAASVLPAEAQTVVSPTPDQSTTSPLTPTRNEYLRSAQTQFDEWAQNMANLQVRILEHKVTLNGEARTNIDNAWNDLKLHWTRLQQANDQDWISERRSWEMASDTMKRTWDRFISQ
jgi:hypothetical protein